MSLPPHAWDDAIHRAAIHRAADEFWLAHHAQARAQAHRKLQVLERLIADAESRRCMRELSLGVALGLWSEPWIGDSFSLALSPASRPARL